MNVRFPMKAWFQFPNFESKDLDFSNPKAAIEYWNSVDKKKLDKMQKKLDSEGEDYCPWGLGLTSTNAIHIHRNGVMSDTFDISLTTVVNKKFLGLINHTQQVEEIKENISSENIPEYITNFFEIESFPEGSTPTVNKQNSNITHPRKTLIIILLTAIILFGAMYGAVTVVSNWWDNLGTSTYTEDQTLPSGFYGEYSERRGQRGIRINKDGTYNKHDYTGKWKISNRTGDSNYDWSFDLEMETPSEGDPNHYHSGYHYPESIHINYSVDDYYVLSYRRYIDGLGGSDIIMRIW
jgi:hypothetical protein